LDLILLNGKFETMNSLNPRAEAVAIVKGKFYKVGSNEEVLQLKSSDTKIIDLKGNMVVPGFNDSHMHLAMFGSNLLECDLVGTESVDDIIERMQDFIQKNKIEPGRWVTGKGWNEDYFNIRMLPTRYDLDKISTEHNICLTRACYHTCVVNSKGLETAGVTKDNVQIEGGRFEVDEKGVPIGICREKALKYIYSKLPSYNVEDIKKMIRSASDCAVSKGLTSIQTDDFMLPGVEFEQILEAYKELHDSGELKVRIYEQCLLPTMDKLQHFLEKGCRTGEGDEYFKFGPLKLLADGSLGPRTAYLREPYADQPSTSGIPAYSQDGLNEIVKKAHDAGMQIAVHCIGDKAMYMVFEAFENACVQNPRKDPRHTVVHCQITDEILLDKFREDNVVATIQPIFLNYDLHMAEGRIGKERVKTSYNWKSLFDRGVHVACGSDCPVEPFDVLPGIYAAVTRKDLKGYPENGWLPEQKLSVYQALYGFTLGSAYASFEENIKGSIEEGKLADMAVLSDDIYQIEPDKIKDVEVMMTFVNGKLVYKK